MPELTPHCGTDTMQENARLRAEIERLNRALDLR